MDSEPGSSSLFQRVKKLFNSTRRSATSQELEREIQGLVDEGEAQGLITPHEGDMIGAVLELDQTTAGQVMVPRTEMAMISADGNIDDVIQVIVESGHSRIPVFSDDPDHIVGVIHAKDLLPWLRREKLPEDLSEISRKPFFVPQAMKLDELLAALRRRHIHLAVVVDEYGGTAGVVSLEDVLEEIVGEIEDEYDHEEQLLLEKADGTLMVDGRLEVEDLAEHLGIELPDRLPEGSFETVGGFITTILGRVPLEGEEVSYHSLRMVVMEADERRVKQVQVIIAPEDGEATVGD